MVDTQYNFDDTEDPPPYWFNIVKEEISHLLSDNIFTKYPKNSFLSIVFTNDQHMKSINRQFRNIDKTTDVLSFPYNEKVEDRYFLGEIIISINKATRDARSNNISLLSELFILIIHGITHILGYDHHNNQQELEMKTIEKQLMQHITCIGRCSTV